MSQGASLAELAIMLTRGQTTSRALIEDCLERIDDRSGEGARAFLYVAREKALAAAQAADELRNAGAAPSPYAGIPVSIKDLFDVAGEVTRAGSRVLADTEPAERDAVAVQRLKTAGFVIIGRTNMTEFAFSGVGINPHFGTPKNIWDRQVGRVPGGSSSGAAISVVDGMAYAALGTDTGGSCRIPAAFNGIVGYKPTARRVPLEGAIPLSPTLDSIGPLARTVRCCAAIDAILAGEPEIVFDARDVRGLRIAVPRSFVLDDMDKDVALAFDAALSRLSEVGAHILHVAFPEIDEIPRVNAKGGFSAPESYAWHKKLIEKAGALYDPRVLARIKRGAEQSAVDYIDLIHARRMLIAQFEKRMEDYDLIAFPTAPIVPPRIDTFDKDEDFARLNLLILRNPSIINMLDGCAISLPISRPPQAPVGLMLAAPAGQDGRLFKLAAAVERILN